MEEIIAAPKSPLELLELEFAAIKEVILKMDYIGKIIGNITQNLDTRKYNITLEVEEVLKSQWDVKQKGVVTEYDSIFYTFIG